MKRTIDPNVDGWSDQLVKVVPTEIVGAFIAVYGLVQGAPSTFSVPLVWIAMVALTILTPIYLVKSGVTSKIHLAVSSISFAVWSLSIASIFLFPGLPSVIFAVILILWTTAIHPILKSGKNS